MEQVLDDDVARQVAALGAALLEDADGLAHEATERIQTGVPIYTTGLVSTEQLRHTLLTNVEYIFGQLGRRPFSPSPDSYENGRARAQAGVPLTAIMAAYRVAARYFWERLAAAACDAGARADVIVAAATEMWLVLDSFTSDMANGYRDEITARAIVEEQQRSALVQAILDGQLTDTSLWEAADILRLPARGPFAVVVSALAEPARSARPEIVHRLGRCGIASAWGLTHDTEVGITALRDPVRDFDKLTAALEETGRGRAGISPAYTCLAESTDALRLARIALRASTPQRPVTIFNRDPLAIAAVAAPDIMQRLADITLAGLAHLPPADKQLLLETFGAWLNNNGSAAKTADQLYCHPNTIRYRLRRLAEYTGRSLDDPDWIAELVLAYRVELTDASSPVILSGSNDGHGDHTPVR
jgi:hypothetical protein